MIDSDGASVAVSGKLGCTVFGLVVVETLDGIDGELVGVFVDDGELADNDGDNVTGEFE